MWMENANLTAEMFYLPLFMVPLTSRVLLTPTYSTLSPLIQLDIIHSMENPQHVSLDTGHLYHMNCGPV